MAAQTATTSLGLGSVTGTKARPEAGTVLVGEGDGRVGHGVAERDGVEELADAA